MKNIAVASREKYFNKIWKRDSRLIRLCDDSRLGYILNVDTLEICFVLLGSIVVRLD